MTTETSAEHDDQLYEALEAAFAAAESDDLPIETVLPDLFVEHLAPALAAIRRHAAAEALKQQAAALRRVRLGYLKTMLGYPHDSDAYRLTRARAGQVSADAVRLDNAARDIIAEGWEFTCYATWAATRDDPGYGCDTPVEHEGDYCDRHEPEDDEDRWAE